MMLDARSSWPSVVPVSMTAMLTLLSPTATPPEPSQRLRDQAWYRLDAPSAHCSERRASLMVEGVTAMGMSCSLRVVSSSMSTIAESSLTDSIRGSSLSS